MIGPGAMVGWIFLCWILGFLHLSDALGMHGVRGWGGTIFTFIFWVPFFLAVRFGVARYSRRYPELDVVYSRGFFSWARLAILFGVVGGFGLIGVISLSVFGVDVVMAWPSEILFLVSFMFTLTVLETRWIRQSLNSGQNSE
jgi:hypothetical protein